MSIESSMDTDLAATIKPSSMQQSNVQNSGDSLSVKEAQSAIKVAQTTMSQAKNKLDQIEQSEESIQTDYKSAEKNKEQLEVVVQQLQEFVQTLSKDIAFSVDEDSGRNVVKVTNKETGELVRQIPSEEVLQLATRLSEATGLLVDTKA